jgi:hypothetical protein
MVNRNDNEHLLFYDATTIAVVLVTTINSIMYEAPKTTTNATLET